MAEISLSDFQIVGPKYKEKINKNITRKSWKELLKGKPVISIIVLLAIILGCVFLGNVDTHTTQLYYLDHLNESPNSKFYFGTDSLGRDIYAMIWSGGRSSIMIGILSMIIITIIGITYGCISGTASEKVDLIMMRMCELGNSIPNLLIILLLMSVMGTQNIFKISIVIGVTSWFGLARIVRSEVRQIRNSEYVLAAKCMGVDFFNLMIKHLIPNFVSSIMFVVVSSVSSSMSMESTLSFLGLGLPVEVISWGSMLSLANKALLMNTWWVIVIPGAILIVTLICITNIGNYLRKETNKGDSNL